MEMNLNSASCSLIRLVIARRYDCKTQAKVVKDKVTRGQAEGLD